MDRKIDPSLLETVATPPSSSALYSLAYAAIFFILLRLGLVATICAVFFINGCSAIWLGADWTTWYAPSGLASLLLLLGIAGVAFWRSLGSRGLVGDEAAEAG